MNTDGKKQPPPPPSSKNETNPIAPLGSQNDIPPPVPMDTIGVPIEEVHTNEFDPNELNALPPPVKRGNVNPNLNPTIPIEGTIPLEAEDIQALLPVGSSTGITTKAPLDMENSFFQLQEFIERELKSIAPQEHRARAHLFFELAQLLDLVFNDHERALTHYEAAYREDPTFVPALRILRQNYQILQRWDELVEVFEAEIKITADEEQRAALLVMLGEFLAHRLSDQDGATLRLKNALQLQPGNLRAGELLSEIYRERKQWEELVELLHAMSNSTVDVLERSALFADMAAICETHLNRATEARQLYWQAQQINPENEQAALALRRLLLEHQQWRELADLLSQEAGRQVDPETRFGDLYRASRISEIHLQDEVRSASLLETAAALHGTDLLPLQHLAVIYQRSGRYNELAAVLVRQLRLVRQPTERAALCYQLAHVYEDWLDLSEEAINAYRETLREYPGHEAALRALSRIYGNTGRWAELWEVEMLRAERSTDIERRADGYLRAAMIAEIRLGDWQRAAELYDRAHRLIPGQPEAYRALERLFRRAGQWQQLADLNERQAEQTKDRVLAASVLRTTASIYEQMIGNQDRAIHIWEKLQQENPEDREALIQLARLYEETSRTDELARVLESWAEVTEDPLERVSLKRRIGELCEGPLRKPGQAVDTYRAILCEVIGDRPTIDRLKAIYEREGNWAALVEILKQELATVQGQSEKAALYVQIGRLAQDKLGQVEETLEAYESALQQDPQFTPALLALQELLWNKGMWTRLVDILENKAVSCQEASAAAVVLCQAAELCEEKLGEHERAERLYMRALEMEPLHLPARQGLERIYQIGQKSDALEAYYLREAEQAQNATCRLRSFLELASMLENLSGDKFGAAAAYQSAIMISESQPQALRGLRQLWRQTQRWSELAIVLSQIVSSARNPETIISALHEWAEVAELHLPEQGDVAHLYEKILEAVPGDLASLSALERLAYEHQNREAQISLSVSQTRTTSDQFLISSLCMRAAILLLERQKTNEAASMLRITLQTEPPYLPALVLLRQIDEQVGNYGEAAELLLREGEVATAPEAAFKALIRAGDIFLERFNDSSRARSAFDRVFQADPSNTLAFSRLASLLARMGDWLSLVRLYQQRICAISAEEALQRQIELANIYQEKLGDLAAASDVLKQLLMSEPQHLAALKLIASISYQRRSWREAEEYFGKLAEAAANNQTERRLALINRIKILEEQLSEEDLALRLLQQFLAEYPSDHEALQMTAMIYQRKGNWEKTVEMLEDLTHQGAPAERVHYLVSQADIYSRSLSDDEAAMRALRKGVAISVDTGEGIERLIDFFERRGDFEGAVQLFYDELETLPPEGADGAVPARLAVARILAARLRRGPEAEVEIRRALALNPQHLGARLELAALHLWNENLSEAIREYLSIIDREPFSLDALRGLYRVYTRRGDQERAAGAAQAICVIAGNEAPEHRIAVQSVAAVEASLVAATSNQPLGVQDFWQLIASPEEPKLARELLFLLADYLPQIFPDAIGNASYGNVTPIKRDDLVWQNSQMIANILGVERFECCLANHWSSFASAIPGTVPRLVLDQRFVTRASPGEFRFVVSRALSAILTRSFYLQLLSERSVENLFASLLQLFEHNAVSLGLRGDEVTELAKVLGRVLPRKLRKALEAPVAAYAATKPPLVGDWSYAAQRSCERAGLLLAGDLGAALAVISAEKAPTTVQSDLLRYSLSPHFYEVRRRIGLALS